MHLEEGRESGERELISSRHPTRSSYAFMSMQRPVLLGIRVEGHKQRSATLDTGQLNNMADECTVYPHCATEPCLSLGKPQKSKNGRVHSHQCPVNCAISWRARSARIASQVQHSKPPKLGWVSIERGIRYSAAANRFERSVVRRTIDRVGETSNQVGSHSVIIGETAIG